jgi:hypothetical protein
MTVDATAETSFHWGLFFRCEAIRELCKRQHERRFRRCSYCHWKKVSEHGLATNWLGLIGNLLPTKPVFTGVGASILGNGGAKQRSQQLWGNAHPLQPFVKDAVSEATSLLWELPVLVNLRFLRQTDGELNLTLASPDRV